LRKTPILTNFEELGHDLEEFPEFPALAAKVGLKNFADALETDNHFSLNKENQLKQILARFILCLGMASVGEFKIPTGKKFGLNTYKTMPLFVSPINIYHQAQELYQAALRVHKGYCA